MRTDRWLGTCNKKSATYTKSKPVVLPSWLCSARCLRTFGPGTTFVSVAGALPSPVETLLYQTRQRERARQRSQKGKSIHFLQNIESGLPFHPQRDTLALLCSRPPSFSSTSTFLHFSISAWSSLTPSPAPPALNSVPFLLTSKKNLHLWAF